MDIASMSFNIKVTWQGQEIEVLKLLEIMHEYCTKTSVVEVTMLADVRVTNVETKATETMKQKRLIGTVANQVVHQLAKHGLTVPTALVNDRTLLIDRIRFFFTSEGKVLYAEKVMKEILVPTSSSHQNENKNFLERRWIMSTTTALRRAIKNRRPDLATRILVNNRVLNKRRWFQAVTANALDITMLSDRDRKLVVAWIKNVLKSPKSQALILMHMGKVLVDKLQATFGKIVADAEPKSGLMFLADTALMKHN